MTPRFTPLLERLAREASLEVDDFTAVAGARKSILKARGLLSQAPVILGYVKCVSCKEDASLSSLTYQRHPKTSLAPPELKQIHPLGKSPPGGR